MKDIISEIKIGIPRLKVNVDSLTKLNSMTRYKIYYDYILIDNDARFFREPFTQISSFVLLANTALMFNNNVSRDKIFEILMYLRSIAMNWKQEDGSVFEIPLTYVESMPELGDSKIPSLTEIKINTSTIELRQIKPNSEHIHDVNKKYHLYVNGRQVRNIMIFGFQFMYSDEIRFNIGIYDDEILKVLEPYQNDNWKFAIPLKDVRIVPFQFTNQVTENSARKNDFKNVKKTGKRFIPKSFILPSSLRSQFSEFIKFFGGVLYIDPKLILALEYITRGRVPYETTVRYPELTRKLQEHFPQQVRIAIKKGAENQKLVKVGDKSMIPLNLELKRLENGDIEIVNPYLT